MAGYDLLVYTANCHWLATIYDWLALIPSFLVTDYLKMTRFLTEKNW